MFVPTATPRWQRSHGGLDFQLLGIGRTGHIGFNEPGSHQNSANAE